MTEYLLSVYQPDGGRPEPQALEAIMREVYQLRQEMKAAGAWVFSGGLCPPGTATVVRSKGNDFLTTDGPYVESKEHIGGFTIVRAPDLDSALEWGRRFARIVAPLAVEVRPFYEDQGG